EADAAGAAIRQRVELAVELERAVTAKGAPNHLDVFTCARERLVRRLPVPALDHLGTGDAEPEHEPAVREVVECDRGHGGRGGGTRRELYDAGADMDPFGVGGDPGGVGE